MATTANTVDDAGPQHRLGVGDSLNVVTSLCLTYSLCIAGLRVWVRRGNYGLDDVVILVATVIGLGHFACDYLALSSGLGNPWRDIDNVVMLNAASLAGVVTFVASLYASKCAVLVFLARITKQKQQVRMYRLCLVIVAALGLASVLTVTAACPLKSGFYWAFAANETSCPSQAARWQVFTAIDILTELLLLVLPLELVWGLHMPRTRKATILVAFYLRLPVIGLSIGRTIYTQRMQLHGVDPGLGAALVLIWLEIETTYALASSTLSALKAFTESFNSGFGLGFARHGGSTSYGMSDMSGGSSSSNKKEKKVLRSNASTKSNTRPRSFKGKPKTSIAEVEPDHLATSALGFHLRPDEAQTSTSVRADRSTPSLRGGEHRWRDQSSHGSERTTLDDMVIVRETEYSVHHHDIDDKVPILPAGPGGVR